MRLSTEKTNRKLRVFTGCLIAACGMALIASLWFRKLSGIALGDALLGAVYLIIAIGVFGQSRFSLFLAAVVPATVSTTIYVLLTNTADGNLSDIMRLRVAADVIITACAALALWRARNLPSI